MAMLDALRERGFTPDDDGCTFDLADGDTYRDHLVRVVMDDNTVTVIVMTGNQVEYWNVCMTEPPLRAVVANIDIAIADSGVTVPAAGR
jgi:hypothetical protein